MVGIISSHFAAFTYNELFDYLSGADQLADNSPGGYVTTPGTLLSGKCSTKEIRTFAFGWLCIAIICAGIISLSFNDSVGIVFLFGIFLAYFYTAPPLKLAYRGHGLGEVAAFLGFGLIPTIAAYCALATGPIFKPLLLSTPLGLLVVALLIEHDYLHWRTDKLAKKHTPVVILGPTIAWIVLGIVLVASYISIIEIVGIGMLSPWILVLLLTMFPILYAWIQIRSIPTISSYKNLILFTSQVHILSFVGIILSLVLANPV